MRSFFCSIFLVLASGLLPANSQNFCPVNFNGDDLSGMRREPTLHYGKMLACNGEILKMVKGNKELPYFQLKLEKGGEIWVSAQVEGGFEQIGTKVRVLGFFEKAAVGYKPPHVNSDAYHLVSIAVLQVDSGEMMMQSGQEKIVQQWVDGKIPDPGKRKWQH